VRVVVDTNVLLSGIFFSGPPARILQAWQEKEIQLVLSEEILTEYQDAASELTSQYPNVDVEPILSLIAIHSELIESISLTETVCDDPDDDKFIACALAAEAEFIVTGDKALLRTTGYRDVQIIKPRDFVDTVLG